MIQFHFGQPSWSQRWPWIYLSIGSWQPFKSARHGGWLYLALPTLWKRWLKHIVAVFFLVAALAVVSEAQIIPPADVPVTHISISASFNGYDSNGKYVESNVDTLGIAIYRNPSARQGFNVAYEHVSIPTLGQRWELGLGSYWLTLPKVNGILFDTSNFVLTLSAGAGKLLSQSDGNHFAWTISPSVTYPIAGHMAWTVSYQYLRATGGISGLLNRSYSAVGTGPAIYF